MAKSEFTLSGAKAVIKKLHQLDKKVANKITRTALRKALRPTLKAAKEEAPVDSGDLKKSIKLRAKKRSKSRIGFEVRVGEGDFRGDTFYAAMVEYGTSKQLPQGYMRRAFEKTSVGVRGESIRLIAEGIENAAKQ